MRDEVLEEVWRNRDQFAQCHNYDLDAIVAELQKMERHPLNRLVDRRKAMMPNKVLGPTGVPLRSTPARQLCR